MENKQKPLNEQKALCAKYLNASTKDREKGVEKEKELIDSYFETARSRAHEKIENLLPSTKRKYDKVDLLGKDIDQTSYCDMLGTES